MISLVRIDDRLVHAQVVVGWLEYLRCRHILVADDRVAQDEEQLDLLRMVIPEDVRIDAVEVASIVDQSGDIDAADRPVLVLFADPMSLRAAVDAGFKPRLVNLGGMHDAPGRHSWIHGLFASDSEIAAIRDMIGMGIEFEIRSVPAARRREVEGAPAASILRSPPKRKRTPGGAEGGAE
ncbi:PTS sugar transporter subunit IIB [bacterium]|nr:PTS sugar transporter subunit IIB [bacterium]